MKSRTRHYGWMVSPYSAKTRSYLRYSGVDFADVAPSLPQLAVTIRRAVGSMIMPTVQLPDGSFIKDSSRIIDHFEPQSSAPSITPETPRQRLASVCMELLADEWLPLASLHFRWTREASARFATVEFGDAAAPWLPPVLRMRVGAALADRMRSYLPLLGIDERTGPQIERSTRALLADLESQLSHSSFILGERPCLGDFALYGPIFAHLYRDPGSRGEFDDLPFVRAYLERMESPRPAGPFVPGDLVPEPIERILSRAFRDAFAYFDSLVSAIERYVADNPAATRVPRSLGEVEFNVDGVVGRRRLVTAAQWKIQRIGRTLEAMSAEDRESAATWVRGLGGAAVLRHVRHPLTYRGNNLVLDRARS